MLVTAALCLLGHLDPTHFAGALSEDVKPAARPVEQMTREELKAELAVLDPQRTAFIRPVVMAGSGAIVAIAGAVIFFAGVGVTIGVASSSGTASMLAGLALAGYLMMGIGAVVVIVGGVFIAIGLLRLFPELAHRREAMQRRDEVLRQLEVLDPKDGSPPAPPMRPGDVWLSGPRPSLVLAEF